MGADEVGVATINEDEIEDVDEGFVDEPGFEEEGRDCMRCQWSRSRVGSAQDVLAADSERTKNVAFMKATCIGL